MPRFHVTNTKYRNYVKVIDGATILAILAFEKEADTDRTMVHLPYLRLDVELERIRFIWRHLACHLPFSDYIAYIEDRPAIQRLVEELGFKQDGDHWTYVHE